MRKDLKNIVLAAIGGDRNAFGTLYEEYSVDMYRFALSICKNTHDAQDAVQETALSVFKSISSLKNPEKFKSYLFLSLSNTCKRKMAGKTETAEFVDTGYTDSEIEFSIPALFEALSRSEEIEKQDLSFLEMVAFSGDKMSDKLHTRMNKYLEKGGSTEQMTEAYGLTECLSAACISPFFAHKYGSTGLPLPDNKIKICKFGTHEELPRGEDGEICITGPTLMKGYYKNEIETNLALQVHEDGEKWLHTGDIGCMDEDGYLYYRQRHCKMIISAGYNIYPTQIEEVINGCNGVAVSCVVGIEDRSVGQRVVAVVQPTSMSADLDALRERIFEACKKNVAEYAMPREVIFKEELPRTAMGKINFKKLTADMNEKKG